MDDDSPLVQNGGEQFDHVERIDGVEELGQISVVRYAWQPFICIRVAHLNLVAEHLVVHVIHLRLGDQVGRADLGLEEALEKYAEMSFLSVEKVVIRGLVLNSILN